MTSIFLSFIWSNLLNSPFCCRHLFPPLHYRRFNYFTIITIKTKICIAQKSKSLNCALLFHCLSHTFGIYCAIQVNGGQPQYVIYCGCPVNGQMADFRRTVVNDEQRPKSVSESNCLLVRQRQARMPDRLQSMHRRCVGRDNLWPYCQRPLTARCMSRCKIIVRDSRRDLFLASPQNSKVALHCKRFRVVDRISITATTDV